MPSDRSPIIKKISEQIRFLAPEGRAFLYGSTARGTYREDSDIDILIVLPDSDNQEAFAKKKVELTEKLYDIELEYGVEVSPLIVLKSFWERMKTPFTCNVAKDGVVL